mmetsp:Transcript_12498/g.42301  ORF Transcript_12498/g.42301 Transcript_12498/m.42301 type:complete len:326 (-) Transcript_12498:166-1143(-)
MSTWPATSVLRRRRHGDHTLHRTESREPYPTKPHEEALLGAAAAAAACLVSNPLDVARVHAQLAPPREALPGVGGVLRRVVSTHGYLGLTRGMAYGLSYNVALNSLRFSMFSALAAQDDGPGLPAPAAGVCAGFCAGLMASPLARARTLMQEHALGSPGWRAPSAAQLLGTRPFDGALAWALRNAGHTGCIFGLYGPFKRALEERLPSAPSTLVHLLAALHAATLSCAVMNPLDLVATRLYAQSGPGPGPGAGMEGGAAAARVELAYTSALDCVLKTVAAEGPAGLYRGLAANVCRIVPHTAVTFAVAEALRGALFAGRQGGPGV